MVGDWVSLQGRYIRVAAVYRNMIIPNPYDDLHTCIGEEHLQPIPLTPEILKKNGFGYIETDKNYQLFYPGEYNFCEDMNLHIGTDYMGNCWLNTRCNSIYGLYFVHQLQRALKICNIDKQIVV